jgi:branched-chain amino acid transport system substrate-binding protein
MMKPTGPALIRRELLVSLGALAVVGPGVALACHERDHPPCHAAALVSLTGPSAPIFQQAVAAIRAMGEQLQQTDPGARGHLGIIIIDSAGRPEVASTELRRLMTSGIPPAAVIVADALPPRLLDQLGMQSEIPLISILTSGSVTASEWVFHLSPNTIQIANAMVSYLAASPGQRGKSVNIVSAAASAGRVAEFINVVEAAGKRVDVRVRLAESMPDFAVLEPDIRRSAKNSGWIISAPPPSLPAIVDLIWRTQDEAPIIIDAGLVDPVVILRAVSARNSVSARNVVAVSPFAPELVDRRSLAAAIARQVRETTGSDLSPVGAITATAVQVLAQAVVTASVRGDAYGQATRDSLRAVSLPGNELILPWEGVSFDATFQNSNARAVALGLRENRVITVLPG